MDDNALLNAGQSSPAPTPQQSQADSSAPSGGFQRPQGVDENTGSDIANAVAQTPNPLHTVVRSMSGAILGALGHAAKLAAQYAPQVAAGLPSNTPLGGAGRQAGQEVMQERQQKQAEADKQKLMSEQENQRGFERSMADKNYALEQARQTRELAHFDLMDQEAKSKFLQEGMDRMDAITASGGKPFTVGGVPAPEFDPTDQGVADMEKYARENQSSVIGNLKIQHAVDPATGKFKLMEVPPVLHLKMPNGQQIEVDYNDPYAKEKLDVWKTAMANDTKQQQLALSREKWKDQLGFYYDRLKQAEGTNDARLRVQIFHEAGDYDTKLNQDLQKTQADITKLSQALKNPGVENAALKLLGYDNAEDARARLGELQSQEQEQQDHISQFRQQIVDPAKMEFGKLSPTAGGNPNQIKVGDIQYNPQGQRVKVLEIYPNGTVLTQVVPQ